MRLICSIVISAVALAAQYAPVTIAPLGWGLCLIPGMCPNWVPTPFDPDVVMIPPHGKDTVAIHYVINAVDVNGSPRLFVGDFKANASGNSISNVDNSTVIGAGRLLSASITVTEYQKPDVLGNPAAPITYHQVVLGPGAVNYPN